MRTTYPFAIAGLRSEQMKIALDKAIGSGKIAI